jgi:hypothetical protein
MMKFLREPLVHFLLLGAALFGIFALVGKWTSEQPGQIVITPGMIENLRLGFTRSAGHEPTPQELNATIDDYVREEVLDREAIARGLDRDDPVIRRRLRERMEFFTEDSVESALPTDQDLEDFLQKNPQMFRQHGHTPALAEVRDAVQQAWTAARRRQANDAAYQQMKQHYTIVVQQPKPGDAK